MASSTVLYFARLLIMWNKPQQKKALHDVLMAGTRLNGAAWLWQPT